MNNWTDVHENILIKWADKAMSYRWMHQNCNKKFSWYNGLFTIPVITISIITGTTNFSMEHMNDDLKHYVPMIIGTLNIISGLMGTIHQYLKISELKEAHRLSYIAWDKLYCNIKLELLKERKDRCDVSYFLRNTKEEYDRLMEISPCISDSVIYNFVKIFKNENFTMPEVCNYLSPTKHNITKRDVIESVNIDE